MRLFSWNVNGLRSVINKGDFKQFIDKYQPDVLCLQETKAQRGQAEIDLPEYEEIWNSAEKPGYSGTAMFTKVKPISVSYGFVDAIAEKYGLTKDDYGDPTKEGRVITAEFEKFWVVNCYTPNSKRELTRLDLRHKQWDPAFIEHIKELEKQKPVLVCGDLNVSHTAIDLANPKQNERNSGFTVEERDGFDKLESAGFVDVFRKKHPDEPGHYTYWAPWANARARNVGWRIDYWLASKSISARVNDPSIYTDVMGSDHCPISIEIEA